MTDLTHQELDRLLTANQRREEELHALQLCTDSQRPTIQLDAFMDLVLTALGVDKDEFRLAVETRMSKLYDDLESQVARAKLTQGVAGPQGNPNVRLVPPNGKQ